MTRAAGSLGQGDRRGGGGGFFGGPGGGLLVVVCRFEEACVAAA
tara:strand:- start:57 stop:188 length:132 start_codon:yes stop_codon:yes gene_type:complete